MPNSISEITIDCHVAEVSKTVEVPEGAVDVYEYEGDVSEIEKDPDPFYALLTILREGEGNGVPRKKWYSRQAVKTTAKMAPGILGYLGHQRAQDRETEYRLPQMKILKSWTTEEVIQGEKRLVAKAKAFVSKRAEDLRVHIREGMAGPVSLDGRARLTVSDGRTVVKDMVGLKCVDFCNPGTEGVKGAGVDAVVTEINVENPNGDNTKMDRLSIPELRKEYELEVREIERTAAETAEAPLVKESTELRATIDRLEKDVETHEAQVAEMKTQVETSTAGLEKIKAENAELRCQLRERDLVEYAATKVSALEDVSDEVREMIASRVQITVVDGDDTDLTKSKAEVDQRVVGAHDEIKRISEMTGGSIAGKKTAEKAPAAAGGNPPSARTSEDRSKLNVSFFSAVGSDS